MSSDDHARNSYYPQNRKPGPSKPQGHGYSPSTNYNYGNTSAHGNSMHGNSAHGSHGNMSTGNKPFHRKPGGAPFKRDGASHGSSDKIIKQNDMIIRLLTEIRDRLPEPPNAKKVPAEPVELIDGIDNEETAVENVFDADESDAAQNIGAEADIEQDAEAIAEDDDIAPVNVSDKVQFCDDDELDNKVNGNY